MGNFKEPKKQDEYEFEKPDVPNLNAILLDTLAKTQRRPAMFPAINREVPDYWRSHQEPGNDFTERVEWIPDSRSKFGGYWSTPYIDRLRSNLKLFLDLPHLYQVFVIENIEKGVPWRGDKIGFYKMIIAEDAEMREATTKGTMEEYVVATFKKLGKIGGFRELPYDKNERM